MTKCKMFDDWTRKLFNSRLYDAERSELLAGPPIDEKDRFNREDVKMLIASNVDFRDDR